MTPSDIATNAAQKIAAHLDSTTPLSCGSPLVEAIAAIVYNEIAAAKVATGEGGLLPCPFCGAALFPTEFQGIYGIDHKRDCFFGIHQLFITPVTFPAWNTRTGSPATAEKECNDCHHRGPLDAKGYCLVDISHLTDPEGPCSGHNICYCKCVFPAATAGGNEEGK